MPMLQPACRARHLKEVLASVDRLPGPAALRVREALEPARLTEIEEATGLEWFPIEANLQLTRAIHAVLGDEESRRFHRAHFAAVFRGPIFAAVVRGAAAVFGADPVRWVRLLPDTWTLTFRDCGAWQVEPMQGGTVALTLRELPAACVADRVWPQAVAASASAMFDVAGREGVVELLSVIREMRVARFQMSWKPG